MRCGCNAASFPSFGRRPSAVGLSCRAQSGVHRPEPGLSGRGIQDADRFFGIEIDGLFDHGIEEEIVTVHRLKTLLAARAEWQAGTAGEGTPLFSPRSIAICMSRSRVARAPHRAPGDGIRRARRLESPESLWLDRLSGKESGWTVAIAGGPDQSQLSAPARQRRAVLRLPGPRHGSYIDGKPSRITTPSRQRWE